MARGFFNYLEKLKYEYYLKESLKQMNVAEDLEKDDLDSRRYRYLDDDGSLSPIEESAAEEETAANLEHDECDIKLVVSDIFIPFCFGRAGVDKGRFSSCSVNCLILESLKALGARNVRIKMRIL